MSMIAHVLSSIRQGSRDAYTSLMKIPCDDRLRPVQEARMGRVRFHTRLDHHAC